ncbi:unnamed protein product [Discosporangium mesarthrocarpum]
MNEGGSKVKITTTVKVLTQQTRVHNSCFERAKWDKFGLVAQVDDNSNYTIIMEQIKMETPKESRTKTKSPTWRTGRAMWGAGGGEGPSNPMTMGEDLTKIRVTNISEDTSEADLRDLFSPFGRINRCVVACLFVSVPCLSSHTRTYLAKDPETMQSSGFAFVSFYSRSDVEAAMAALQGYRHDHLILKLKWAKPSLLFRRSIYLSGEGGLGGMRTSGYGERLAQDTKQQVSYASNLTK